MALNNDSETLRIGKEIQRLSSLGGWGWRLPVNDSETLTAVKEISDEVAKKIFDYIRLLIPVSIQDFPFLEGWTWKNDMNFNRVTLTRGGPIIQVFNDVEVKRGWIHQVFVLFNDPNSVFHFQCDNWDFALSPLQANLIMGGVPNNVAVYSSVYNPASIMGPIYGINWAPSVFWPYKTQIKMEVYHPTTAPTVQSQLIGAAIGRHIIIDEKQFYESIIRVQNKQFTSLREMTKNG